MLASRAIAVYRLRSDDYVGWRIRDVWRKDPNALLRAAMSPTTHTRDAIAIRVFLTLFGGIAHRNIADAQTTDAGSASAPHYSPPPSGTPARITITPLPGLYRNGNNQSGDRWRLDADGHEVARFVTILAAHETGTQRYGVLWWERDAVTGIFTGILEDEP